MYKLILASGSPRRAELLQQLGLRFDSYKPEIDETPMSSEPGLDYVVRMSKEKLTQSLQAKNLDPETVLICADTTVLSGKQILGKPADKLEAIEMLQVLSDKTHKVITSVSMGSLASVKTCFSVETKVTFRALTLSEIEMYWSSGEPRDKAGAYGIQGLGAIFVSEVSGSYSNVVGLPLMETAQALETFDIYVLKTEATSI